MGFVLGAAIATRLQKGFLPVRKAGKIPVDTTVVTFTNYFGRTQDMELRKPAFRPQTRVLLVDQWIETGGTMDASIRLVEGQDGIVAGLVAVCIEENEKTNALRQKYKYSSAVLPGSATPATVQPANAGEFRRFSPGIGVSLSKHIANEVPEVRLFELKFT